MIERSCQKGPKSAKPGEALNKDSSTKPIITDDIKMLVVYSLMTKGFQKYFETIGKERKELVKREEIIQNELDKIENKVTNFIMT